MVHNGVVSIAQMEALVEGDEAVLKGHKSAYFFIIGYVTQIFTGSDTTPKPLFYLACPQCKAKVIDEADGFKCFKCQQTLS